MRRAMFAVAIAVLPTATLGKEMPGVSKQEIAIGGVFAFSGPASSIGAMGRGVSAYVNQINDRGGINGRKLKYITYDDSYSSPKAVEQIRKLVEQDEVAFIYSQFGTPGNSATARYLLTKKSQPLLLSPGQPSSVMFSNFH